jgi:adenosylhomocysteine nucleosidase
VNDHVESVILISAGAEWRALTAHFPDCDIESSPYGDCFTTALSDQKVALLHGGWGKVAAAGSTQYAIDRWQPQRVVNLGTCGGFAGQIERGVIILVEKTIIYDIIEQMTDQNNAISHYSCDLDLSWVPEPPPQPVLRGTLVSADRDIRPEDILDLIQKYQAPAGDWESGAIAWVAKRNNLPCLILRGVSDLVDPTEGEAYGNYAFFEEQTRLIINNLVEHLPAWLVAFEKAGKIVVG